MGCRHSFDINTVGKAALSHCQIYYLKVLNLKHSAEPNNAIDSNLGVHLA